jgi:hypothetical protein
MELGAIQVRVSTAAVQLTWRRAFSATGEFKQARIVVRNRTGPGLLTIDGASASKVIRLP